MMGSIGNDLASSVAIVGIAETVPSRHRADDLASLVVDVTIGACKDAGVSPKQIDGIVTENTLMPALTYELGATLGLSPDLFTAHIGETGAGTVASPLLAAMAIRHGLADTVLCFFGVKFGSDTGGPYGYHAQIEEKANLELPFGMFPQAAYLATTSRRYLDYYGYDESDLAQVAISQRSWAAMHPEATKRDEPLTLEEYFRKPVVAAPLRNADCSLISDGAAAFIMTSVERAKDLRHSPVVVTGCARAVDPTPEHSHLSLRRDHLSLPSWWSGPRAFREAEISPADVDLFELYDCFSIVPVIQLEDLRVCNPGEGLSLYRKGDTAPGGAIPVNTNGGLLAHSYLLGISHVCETVTQLRGQAGARQVPDARIGVVGGWAAMDHSTAVLEVLR